MNILITGGNSFIARNIKEQLGHKYNIYSPSHQELDLLNIDSIKNVLINNKFKFIIHTATYDASVSFYKKDPSKVLENNLRMFFNLENLNNYYDFMINLGSGAEYNIEYWKNSMNESYFGAFIPKDQYGLSKYICSKFINCCDMEISNMIHLRLFSVFGKYEDLRVRFLSNAIYQNIHKLQIKINENNRYDFLYINDFIRILDYIINNPLQFIGDSFNVCGGTSHYFLDLAKIIISIGGDYGIDIIDSKNQIEYGGDNLKLLHYIGRDFKFTDINDSIKDLYEWYKKQY